MNYDLKKPGQDYSSLFEAIQSCGDWWHHLGSTWLLDTNLTAQGIWNRIEPRVDKNDFFLIIGVTRDYQGWLPEDAWKWINERSGKMAA
ncbi:MAG TPA: hypothetical protein VHA70_04630 [Bauldia sp.]|nr:hypothetical protein [Bauldia sp.]